MLRFWFCDVVLDSNRQSNLCKTLPESPGLHPDSITPSLKGRGDRYLEAVATHRPDITSIDLKDMSVNQNIHSFVSNSKKLISVNLEGTNLSEDDVQEIEAQLEINRKTSLTEFLSVNPDTHPDDLDPQLKAHGAGFLETVAQHRPGITTIDLTNMVDITFDEIQNLMQSCHYLTEIKLEGCSQLSQQQLDEIEAELQARREQADKTADPVVEDADGYQLDEAQPAAPAAGPVCHHLFEVTVAFAFQTRRESG